MAVAAIDDDVAFIEVWQQGLNDLVDHGAGFDHDHDPAGGFQVCAHFLDGMSANDRLAGAAAVNKLVDPARRAVVHRHREAMACHIQDEVLAHDREANQADICFCHLVSSLTSGVCGATVVHALTHRRPSGFQLQHG